MKKIAVIGYGGQGAWHCGQILKSDVCTLAGTYDIREVRRNAAAANGIHVYESNEALLADPEVDAVVIATPNDFHEPLVIAGLEAGKHVICEKPVEMSVASVDRMIAAAKKAGKLFTVHHNRRWDVDFLAMKQLAASGEIGKVLCLESRVHGSRGIPSDWRGEKEHGGGMILDWGIHLIDQVLQIFKQKIVRLYCTCSHITNNEVDDGFKLEMYFDGDLSVHVEVGTSNFIGLPRFYMIGRDGAALIPDWGQPARVVWCHNYNEKEVVPVVTAAGITKTMAPRNEQSISEKSIPQPHADVHDYYRNWVRAIDGECEQIVTHHQMMVDMKIMEAAFESDRTGMPVDVDLKF